MIFLLLSILCSALIGNLLILFDKDKKADILLIFLGNYFLASIFSLTVLKTSLSQASSFDIGLGSITGMFFLINFIIYRRNIQYNGLSLSVSTMRISLLIPTVISLIFFGDQIGFINYLGIGIVLFAFIFVTEFKSFHNLLFLFLLFVITGLSDTSLKIYDESGVGHEDLFVFFLFASAFISNLIWVILKGKRLIWKYFCFGLVLGIPNQLTTKLFLLSLATIPAPIAYPLFASSVVLICVIADILIWKKRYSLQQKYAYAIMIAGIVFLNISYN
jgi:drug/metabolite transporter (DMT)-like permease